MSDDDERDDEPPRFPRPSRRIPLREILGNPGKIYDPKTKRVYDLATTKLCLFCGIIDRAASGFNAETRLCRACTAKGVKLLTDALEPLGLTRTPVQYELAFDGLAKLVGYFGAFRR